MEKIAGVSSWRNSPWRNAWRNAQERLTGVGRRSAEPSEEEALAGELDLAMGLDQLALGLRKRGRECEGACYKRPCANHVPNSVQFRTGVSNLGLNATIFKFEGVNAKKKRRGAKLSNSTS